MSIRGFLSAFVGSLGLLFATPGAIADPVLWVNDEAGQLGKVDVATGNVTLVGSMGTAMSDIAFDPAGRLYGITQSTLYRIDPFTAGTIAIGLLGTPLNSLTFDVDGNLFGASDQLYRIDVAIGRTTAIGNGETFYSSSGDLAFIGGNLYLSSAVPVADTLFRLNYVTGQGTDVGPIGVAGVSGLAASNGVCCSNEGGPVGAELYGLANTSVYRIDLANGAGTFAVNYGGHGLLAANGATFFADTTPAVPEPESYALLLCGLAVIGGFNRRRVVKSGP